MSKIFHVITQMEAGGAQGAAVRNSRYFAKRGDDSKVVFLYTKRAVYQGDDIISLLPRSPSGMVDIFTIILNLYKLLKANPGCRVICYTHYANVIGAVIAKLAGVTRVLISHRNPVSTYPFVCRVLDYFIGCTSIYSHCVCVSKTVFDSFSSYPGIYKNKLRLVYNGIDLDKYGEICTDKFSWVKETADRDLVMVSTGRLHPQKNQLVLIQAMKHVSNAKLFIAGEGELRSSFEDEIKALGLEDRVFLIGEIPPEEVQDFLSIADVFLFPSNYEAFGFSVVEAMAVGLPIVCSDIPAMNEIVGEAGLLLDKDNPGLWSQTINGLSKETLARMSSKSVARAKMFSLDNMASEYLRIVTNAI